MERPKCSVCGNRHYASEDHVWKGRDFDFSVSAKMSGPEPVLSKGPSKVVVEPPTEPVREIVPDKRGFVSVATYDSTASKKTLTEQKSRYRSEESTAAYRKYKREYMAKRRAMGYNDPQEG